MQLQASFPASCPIHTIEATLMFDPNVVRNTAHTVGPFLQQDGRAPTVEITRTTNTIRVDMARPPDAPDVSGQGTLLTLPFTLAPGVSEGQVSVLAFQAGARAYRYPSFENCLLAAHGGEFLVIRP